jgi:hypothetical protein
MGFNNPIRIEDRKTINAKVLLRFFGHTHRYARSDDKGVVPTTVVAGVFFLPLQK